MRSPVLTANRRQCLVLGASLWLSATSGPALAGRAGVAAEIEPAPEIKSNLAAPLLQGIGRMTYFGLPVYQAALWTDGPLPSADWLAHRLVLSLTYARALQGRAIAERSLLEMERMQPLTAAQRQAWQPVLQRAFPDVQRGERLSGVYRPGGPCAFYHQAQLSCETRDEELARRFFSIWLSPQTSEPALREALFSRVLREAARQASPAQAALPSSGRGAV